MFENHCIEHCSVIVIFPFIFYQKLLFVCVGVSVHVLVCSESTDNTYILSMKMTSDLPHKSAHGKY